MSRLVNSSKAIAALAGIIVALVLLATGQLDAEQATNAVATLLAALIAAIALEDAALKFGVGYDND